MNIGKSLVEVFAREVHPAEVVGIEQKFRIPLVDPETGEYLIDLVGVFDLIEADGTGNLSIIDHKTCAKRPSESELDQHLQLTAYGYATRILQELNENPILMRIDCLVKNKKPVYEQRFTVRTPVHDRKFFKLAKDVIHAMEVDAFPANPGWQCNSCPVSTHCYMEVN